MSKNKGYSKAPADIAEELEKSVAAKDILPSPESVKDLLKKQGKGPDLMDLNQVTPLDALNISSELKKKARGIPR